MTKTGRKPGFFLQVPKSGVVGGAGPDGTTGLHIHQK